jgi:hypothetical protein
MEERVVDVVTLIGTEDLGADGRVVGGCEQLPEIVAQRRDDRLGVCACSLRPWSRLECVLQMVHREAVGDPGKRSHKAEHVVCVPSFALVSFRYDKVPLPDVRTISVIGVTMSTPRTRITAGWDLSRRAQ